MTRYEPRTAKGIATQGRLVACAREVYASEGRDRFTTEMVASLAGVAIGTVYRYFEDKVDLLNEAVPNRDRELLDQFIGRLKDLDVTKVWESDDYLPVARVDLSDIDKLIEEFTDHG